MEFLPDFCITSPTRATIDIILPKVILSSNISLKLSSLLVVWFDMMTSGIFCPGLLSCDLDSGTNAKCPISFADWIANTSLNSLDSEFFCTKFNGFVISACNDFRSIMASSNFVNMSPMLVLIVLMSSLSSAVSPLIL